MKAMILDKERTPLRSGQAKEPTLKPDEVLVEITTCGVCRTDLHIIDGELTNPKLPLIPGHEIVGTIVDIGSAVTHLQLKQRVGVPWLARTCGKCSFCLKDQENLCDNAVFTGYTTDGGYAEYTVAEQNHCFPIPDKYDAIEAAPLLCAGLIGWRSYRLAGDVQRLGLYGFGGAAHILTQIAAAKGKDVFAFTRPGDERGQRFAKSLGASWAGNSNEKPPELLDAAIIFAPAGDLVVQALKQLRKGGAVVCGGIHMSPIPSIPYDLLWSERIIRSVANLTRHDAIDFLKVATEVSIKVETKRYQLEEANQALDDLRAGRFEGAAVLAVKN